MIGKENIRTRFILVINRIVASGMGLNKTKIAKILGIGPNSITEIMGKRQYPNIDSLSLLSKEFKINLHWLILGEGEIFSSTSISNESLYDLTEVSSELVSEQQVKYSSNCKNCIELELENSKLKDRVIDLSEQLIEALGGKSKEADSA